MLEAKGKIKKHSLSNNLGQGLVHGGVCRWH